MTCWRTSRGLNPCKGCELPVLRLPIVKQKLPHDCGVAVFRSVCRYLKVPTKGNTLDADPMNGLHPFELEPAFRRLGLTVSAGSMDLDDLRHHARKNRPVVALIRFGDSGHWVVSGGVSRGRVSIMEPFDGVVKWVQEAAFIADWQDYDRQGTLFRNYGIAVGV